MGAHFLLRTKINGHNFQKIWDQDEETTIGHPAIWKIEKTEKGVQVTRIGETEDKTKTILIHPDKVRQGVAIKLPPSSEIANSLKKDDFSLMIEPAKGITPVFRSRRVGSETRTIQLDPANANQRELFVFTCFGQWVVESEPLNAGYIRKGYTGYFAGRPSFQIQKKKSGYQLYAYIPLRLQQGLQIYGLDKGKHIALSEEQLKAIKVHVEGCHWRFSHVPSIQMNDRTPDELDPQSVTYKRILGLVFGVFTLGLFILQQLPEPKKMVEISQDVKLDIEQPKIIVKAPEPELPKEEPPKPKPPEPKKVAEAPKPAPKKEAPAPAPKKPEPIAKAKPLPPPPAPKAPPRPQPVAQKPVAPPPVAAPPVAAPPPPNPQAQAQAQAKQMLSKSLGFLSGAKSNISVKTPAYTDTAPPGAYDKLAKTTNPSAISNTALTSMSKNAAATGNSGPISTTSSRNIDTGAAVAGYGTGKTLNEVQGRVAGVGGSGTGFGKGFGSSGAVSTQGPGKLSADSINATLRKIEDKLRFCYEKGLLSNPNLAGNVKIEWTIAPGGKVQGAKIVNSQLGNAQVNQCLTGVISGTKFESPQGGSVIVNKVFSFSASAM